MRTTYEGLKGTRPRRSVHLVPTRRDRERRVVEEEPDPRLGRDFGGVGGSKRRRAGDSLGDLSR